MITLDTFGGRSGERLPLASSMNCIGTSMVLSFLEKATTLPMAFLFPCEPVSESDILTDDMMLSDNTGSPLLAAKPKL